MSGFSLTKVTAENVEDLGFFCVKNRKHPGHVAKSSWLRQRFDEGMRLSMLVTEDGRQAGFMEYVPGEKSWRAIHAPGYLVIHCLWVSSKKFPFKGMATALVEQLLHDAESSDKGGVAVVTSDDPWMVGRGVFDKCGFVLVDKADPHYQLMAKQLKAGPLPSFPRDFSQRLSTSRSLRLLYANQCPYIGKAVAELPEVARRHGIQLHLVELKNAAEARAKMPSPYGVFALVYDDQLLADHPISATRFRNILRKDLGFRETGSG